MIIDFMCQSNFDRKIWTSVATKKSLDKQEKYSYSCLKQVFELFMDDKKTTSKTRDAIMEAAGKIFSEEGYPKATVRDICRQAGANIAAINYHFGDKKGLYLAVLKHYQEIAFQTYPPDLGIKETQRPEEKLRAFIRSFLTRIMDEGRPAWFGKLLAREFTEPTWAFDILVEEMIRPSFKLLIGIVASILNKGRNERKVLLCSMSIVGQCLYFRHSHPVISRLFPGEVFGSKQIEELTEHITLFSLRGLMKERNKKSSQVKVCKKR
ncbi:MAG: CerR family C-terminal domain-containing protein [Deltaproteobacteria bacterium]|nr:CerR family C-terminal domain-containing protein [Deltaproteobacteria bacterium]